jgi:predicted transport protein
VNLNIEETYSKLRSALTALDCKVIFEKTPNQICFKQGSLWGISSRTAKKNLNVNLETVNEGTMISCVSKLASDWKNITLIGCGLAAILIGLCTWMATDLGNLTVTHVPGFWGWLVMVGSYIDYRAAQAFVRLTWGLAGFLSLIIVLEALIVVNARSKIDVFAEENLRKIF